MGIYTHIRFPAVLLTMVCALSAQAYAAAAPGSPDPGRLAFNNNCRTCHSTKEGDNRLGPSLAHIVGAKAECALRLLQLLGSDESRRHQVG